MIWLSWRQQRTETLLAAAMLLLLGALFIPAGVHLASFYAQDNVKHCLTHKSLACAQTLSDFGTRAGILRSVMPWLTLLPGMIGIAVAAPIVLDLENGTYRVAWTQSITRGRWIATRFSLAFVTALAVGGLLAVLFTWYRVPLDKVFGRFDGSSGFDLEGIVPVSYVLFALGLGLAVGVFWRRTAPSVITAFLAYVASRLFVDSWLRQRFVSPLSVTWSLNGRAPSSNILNNAWVLRSGPSDKAGHPFNGGYAAFQACGRVAYKGSKVLNAHCLARHGAGFNTLVYQPSSRFWEFQGIEAALFGGLALLLIAFAAWRVLRTD
jgi:hypothetical protein